MPLGAANVNSLLVESRYIHPKLSGKVFNLLEKRFYAKHLRDILIEWISNPVTWPESWCMDDLDEKDRSKVIQKFSKSLPTSKPELLQQIKELYPDGLSVLQVAQADTKAVIQKIKSLTWTYSTFTSNKEEFVPSIDPPLFLEAFQDAIHPIFIGHAYATAVEDISCTVLRLQPFERVASGNTTMVALSPIMLVFPVSSPHFLHHNRDDLYQTAIFLALSNCLSSPGRKVLIKRSNCIPSKNLHTLSVLKGVSRHASALGAWSLYADGVVNQSPLDMLNYKDESNNGIDKNLQMCDDPVVAKRQRTANIKFTGRNEYFGPPEEYKSRFPMTVSEFKMKEPCKRISGLTTNFTMRLEGNDIFAGMYSMAVKGITDPDRIPAWLTGEESNSSVIVNNGNAER